MTSTRDPIDPLEPIVDGLVDVVAADISDLEATRTRRLLVNSSSAIVARVVATVSGVFVVGATLRYLGAENYGMWQTVTSSLLILGTTDLGMGSALVTRLATLEGAENRDEQRREISTALVLFVIIGVLGALAVVAVVGLLDWASILNTEGTEAERWADPTVLIVGVLTALAIPFGLIDRVQNAIQRSFRVMIAQSLGYAAVPVVIVIAIQMDVSTPVIAGLVLGTAMVFQTANGLLFLRRNPELRPKINLFEGARARRLLRMGSLFFGVTIAGVLAFASDSLVVERVLGPAEAAEYSVAYRLFSVLAIFVVLPLAPLWPAYAEAIERRDLEWVRRVFRRSMAAALGLGAIGGLAIAIGGQTAVDLWVGGEAKPTTATLYAFAIWLPVYCAGNAMAVLLNAGSILKFQLVTAAIMLPVNLALSVQFTYWWGVGGTVFGSLVAFVLLTAGPSLWRLHRFIYHDLEQAEPAPAAA